MLKEDKTLNHILVGMNGLYTTPHGMDNQMHSSVNASRCTNYFHLSGLCINYTPLQTG